MILDLPIADYHRRPERGRSQIMDYWRSPELYHGRYVTETIPPKQATKEMDFGNMIDGNLCDDEVPSVELPEGWVRIPDELCAGYKNVRASKLYKEWREDWVGDSKPAKYVKDLTTTEYERWRGERAALAQTCLDVRQQVESSPSARRLVWHPERVCQPSFFGTVQGVKCKARPDIVIPNMAYVDIKTSAEVGPEHIAKQTLKYGYDVQASLCRWVAYTSDGAKDLPWILVVIRSAPPYEVEVYQLSDAWLQYGYERLSRALEGIAAERWRSPTHGKVTELDPPGWLKYREEWTT